MSIPTTYNRLRKAALDARHIAEGMTLLASPDALRAYHALVIERANVIAASAWPGRMAELAAAGEPIPHAPVRFGASGYTVAKLGNSSGYVCASHEDASAKDYVDQAVAELAPQLAREAELAEATYERYRLAVAQGVAVDPDWGIERAEGEQS